MSVWEELWEDSLFHSSQLCLKFPGDLFGGGHWPSACPSPPATAPNAGSASYLRPILSGEMIVVIRFLLGI